MSVSLVSLLALGFVLGLKHALDADHLAAVSTIATERRSLFGSSLVGALWGIGHTASLIVAGVLVIAFRFEINARATNALEFCVGIMLVGLGVNALRKLARSERLHVHAHEHEGHWHVHPHVHQKGRSDRPHTHHGFRIGARPLVVGIVHGLAGSGALTLLVLAAIPSRMVALIYILVFGVGSIGGMMIMSTLFAVPARLTAKRFAKTNLALRGLAGLFSLAFGLYVMFDVGLLK